MQSLSSVSLSMSSGGLMLGQQGMRGLWLACTDARAPAVKWGLHVRGESMAGMQGGTEVPEGLTAVQNAAH